MERLPRFFALEGIDGSGTTTQLKLLAARFAADRIDGWTTAEPTDGPVGRLIREVLGGRVSLTPETLAHLFVADRHEHLAAPGTGIRARLASGEIVVTDRYLSSSLAYQSVECGFDFVGRLNGRFPMPWGICYLDVATSVGLERSSTRESLEIFEHRSFQDAVRGFYERALEAAESSGVAVHRIDGTAPIEDIHEEIWRIVTSKPIL